MVVWIGPQKRGEGRSCRLLFLPLERKVQSTEGLEKEKLRHKIME